MSKSLGNFFTLRDLTDQGYSGREIRQLMISAHYRETFNFTLDGLAGARTALNRIHECVTKLRDKAGDTTAEPATQVLEQFTAAMDDNLNVSSAWAAVFDWVRDCNRRLLTALSMPLGLPRNWLLGNVLTPYLELAKPTKPPLKN